MLTFLLNFCLGSISNGFGYDDSEEVSFNRNAYDFLVDYDPIEKSSILYIHKHLVGKHNIK